MLKRACWLQFTKPMPVFAVHETILIVIHLHKSLHIGVYILVRMFSQYNIKVWINYLADVLIK